jgi:site-specific DNA recombinase
MVVPGVAARLRAEVIAGRGRIVVEFFDVGCSRSRPWPRRPQAAELLAEVASADRGFDAVVVGEYERAFAGGQLASLLPLLGRHGVQLWLPELGGPVDAADPAHQALLMLLGHQSRREVLRSRFRTLAAMRVQAREQGRHLGGRPPYGYRLVDAGPHPNRAHARWGRRLHRLDPDPVTAPNVRWIFAQRLAGDSTAGIARALNYLGVPSPSAYDRAPNRHRTGDAWTLRAVAEILANPRYTGRQVWNRQSTEHQEELAGDKHTSAGSVRRWNPKDQWVVSGRLAHRPLVSEADFVAAQTITAVATPQDGQTRRYRLTGLVVCGICGRRADAHWVHGRAGYRCRHGRTSASPPLPGRPKSLYWREDLLLGCVARELPGVINSDSDPRPLIDHLRDNRMTIVCATDSITVGRGVPHQRPPPGRSTKRARRRWGLTCPRGDSSPRSQHTREAQVCMRGN